MLKRQITSLLLILSALLVSCGETTDVPVTTTAGGGIEEPVTDTYDYPELDCGGDEFTILNPENFWDMYTHLDFEQMTGEIIDDAIYNRNRFLEDKYKFRMNVVEFPIDDLKNKIQTSVAAQEDIYDVTYVRGNGLNTLITGNMLMNLRDIPEMRLDEEWWNQSMIKSAEIGKDRAIYFAHNYFSLSSFDNVWTIFFNETMLDSLGQPMPYDTVRAGKWTMDVFLKTLKLGANLNGDESFNFSADGKATYGCASFWRLGTAMLTGAGVNAISRDKDNIPYLTLESDRFYEAADKLASFFKTEGDYLEANEANEKNYQKIFMAGRALFLGGGIMSSSIFREMNDDFGILPLPKLDESQNDYYAWMNYDVNTMCVPVTNSDPTRTGIIIDALCYLSWRDVLPNYYNIRVSQKSLRNDDSIEMLKIIHNSLVYDAGNAYGWTLDLMNQVRSAIVAGNPDVASTIASNKSIVEENIQKTLDMIG